MIRKLYTITRDAILGLTELPALHSIMQEATDEAIDATAKRLASTYRNMEYDQDVANLTKERDELHKTIAALSDELETECEVAREVKSYAEEIIESKVAEISELKSQLASHIEAERWRQVTAGEGELPPNIPVFWRNNHPDFPLGAIQHSVQGACGTYEWRYVSSKDVPNG
jgi:predicted ribosome quality control (RQC) complex YloA/Tae2 family protein